MHAVPVCLANKRQRTAAHGEMSRAFITGFGDLRSVCAQPGLARRSATTEAGTEVRARADLPCRRGRQGPAASTAAAAAAAAAATRATLEGTGRARVDREQQRARRFFPPFCFCFCFHFFLFYLFIYFFFFHGSIYLLASFARRDPADGAPAAA
jgi:hypothetical protein